MDRRVMAAHALVSMQRHSWEHGTAMQAFLEWGKIDFVKMMAHEAVYRAMDDGRCATIGVNDAVTDPCSVGEALIAACEATNDPFLIAGKDALLNWALKNEFRNEDGVVYHLVTRKEFWVDSMYMLPPFLAAAGHYDEALTNVYGYWNALYDEEAQLMSHMWDDEKKVFVRKAHWGTGSGWTLAGIARMIGLLPEAYAEDIAKLKEMQKMLLEGVLKTMRPDGLFHDVLDDSTTFIETNTAQMTAYAIYRGVAEGYLPVELKEKADLMNAAANAKMNDYGFVEGVCGAPTFDKPGFSPEGNAFYVLMETAKEKCEKALEK